VPQRTRYYLHLLKRIFSLRRPVLFKLNEKLDRYAMQSSFLEKHGYLPDGLTMNDASVFDLASTARIGKNNKIVLSPIKSLTSARAAKLMMGEYCWTGDNVEINLFTGSQVIIKDYATVQDGCKIVGDVKVEKYCLFGPLVFVSSGNHYAVKDDVEIIRNQDSKYLTDVALAAKHSQPVHIEEDCWMGYGSFIKQGIYIGRGAVLGTHAIITKDVAPYIVMGGANKQLDSRINFMPPISVDAADLLHKPYFYRGFNHKQGETPIAHEEDYIALGKEQQGIITLQKGNFSSIIFSGKVIPGNTVTELHITLVYNGNYTTTCKVPVDAYGSFSYQALKTDFKLLDVPLNDYAFRMADNYNIFQLTLEVPSGNNKSITVFKNFTEQLL